MQVQVLSSAFQNDPDIANRDSRIVFFYPQYYNRLRQVHAQRVAESSRVFWRKSNLGIHSDRFFQSNKNGDLFTSFQVYS